jgi:polyhydroxyalkanoate synthase subunit PhaC
MTTVPQLADRRRRGVSARDTPALDRVEDDVQGGNAATLQGAPGRLTSALGRAIRLSRRGIDLARETTVIVAGQSKVEPVKGDGRFRDETWSSNPAYRRLMQLYLAYSRSLIEAVDEADLDWRNAERARFLLNIVVSSLAPTNTLPGNPAALKHVFETGGGSLISGLRNFVGDARTNRGMPSQVRPDAFEVGRNLAVTPGAVIYRDEVCEVLQYTPTTPAVRQRPALLVPPQIGKYYFMDLAPGRSFVEHAVGQGLSFFVVSWRNPGPEQGDWDLNTYAAAVERAIDAVREISASEDVNLLSLCAGGILTAGLLSHLATQDKHPVHTASFGVTLLDFDVPAPIGALRLGALLSLARGRSSRNGILKASDLGPVFTWMRPDDLVWKYWVNNYLLGKDPPPFDILAWNAAGTNLPSALHRQFIDIFERNAMVSGEIEILGTPVDLSRVTIETYVTGATTDHLTPWQGCYQTTQLLSGPSTFVLSNAGHIASLVNPPGNPKAHYFAGPEPVEDPDEWLTLAEKRQGTWWEHWTAWVLERSGEERPAGPLGSSEHPVLEPAPGTYVHG